jgi:RNA polymerase sigma-70 factor (ECF subfamily)|tara:strand:- start:804 stop:1511 length:708 start_codon:yes stop_codon:yes gene_type:complete
LNKDTSQNGAVNGEKLARRSGVNYTGRMDREAEHALISRCQEGDSVAWDELFDLHYAATSRFVHQLSGDYTWEDSEEICQETFLSVVKNLANFKGGSALQTWIFRIATNKARDYRAKQMAAKRGGGLAPLSLQAEDDEGNRLLDPASPLPSPDSEMLRDEKWRLVSEALEQLGGPCQEILELRYFGDLQYSEISKSLKLNEKTVSSRLSKCRDKLEAVLRRIFSKENVEVMPSKE